MSRDYYDPWAKVGGAATDAMYKYMTSKPDPTKQAAYAASARKDQLEAQMLQNQLNAPDTMRSALADIYAQVEGTRPAADMVGPLPAAAPDAATVQQRFQESMPDLFANAMQFAGDKPGSLGDIYLAFASNSGATDDQVTRAQMGAKMDYANTKEGFNLDPDNSGYTLSPGSVRYDRDNNQIANAPFKKGGGMSFRTNADGTVEFSEDGLPQLLPTTKTTNDLQGQQVSNAGLRGLIKQTRELANKDSNNFGVPGIVKGAVQDINQVAEGITKTMGGSAAIDQARQLVGKSRIDPTLLSGIFDPNLPALQTASDLLVFQAASALADQQGRGLSNEDVKYFKRIVGSPNDIFSSQQKFLSKLDTIESILGIKENVADTTLGGNVTGRASGQPATPPAGQLQPLEKVTVDGVNPVQPKVQKWGRDAQGNPVLLGGQ